MAQFLDNTTMVKTADITQSEFEELPNTYQPVQSDHQSQGLTKSRFSKDQLLDGDLTRFIADLENNNNKRKTEHGIAIPRLFVSREELRTIGA